MTANSPLRKEARTSFVSVCACFFHTPALKAEEARLKLAQLPRECLAPPTTSQLLSDCKVFVSQLSTDAPEEIASEEPVLKRSRSRVSKEATSAVKADRVLRRIWSVSSRR